MWNFYKIPLPIGWRPFHQVLYIKVNFLYWTNSFLIVWRPVTFAGTRAPGVTTLKRHLFDQKNRHPQLGRTGTTTGEDRSNVHWLWRLFCPLKWSCIGWLTPAVSQYISCCVIQRLPEGAQPPWNFCSQYTGNRSVRSVFQLGGCTVFWLPTCGCTMAGLIYVLETQKSGQSIVWRIVSAAAKSPCGVALFCSHYRWVPLYPNLYA